MPIWGEYGELNEKLNWMNIIADFVLHFICSSFVEVRVISVVVRVVWTRRSLQRATL